MRVSNLLWLLLLLAAHSVGAQQPPTAASDPLALQRNEFRAAFEHARAGGVSATPDPESLRVHPLYGYLQAERLAVRLAGAIDSSTAADADAARFLDAHDGEPVTWPLRHAWLMSLARRERWEAFLERYRADFSDEALHCQYLTARIALERLEGIAPLIIERWLTARQLPSECEPVFQWLRSEAALTDQHIERRAQLLLENGQASFARVIARRLPEDRAAPLLYWADLIERPAEGLAAHLAAPVHAIGSEVLLDVWARLSRDDPEAALNLYASLRAATGPNEAQASAYALALALGLAWDRRGEALDFFDLVAAEDMDDYALGWRARAALWAGDWALAESAVAAMSERARMSATWRYWAARIAEVRHGRGHARAGYESLLGDDNYYSGLAAAQLRRRLRPNLEPLPRDTVVVTTLGSQAAFMRARALFDIGLPVAALREWRYGFSQLDTDAQRQGIHLAADWQRYDLAVATATRFGVFNDYRLLYPMPFGQEVLAASESTDLAIELIYGVIRQESLYRADAVSNAGARGLMQLTPGTAAQIIRRLDEPSARSRDLFDPFVNIRLGTAELNRLLARYDGALAVALAAYNAGPNAAERWLPEDTLDADVWVENIPFNETRGYVQRVLWNALVFRWLETSRPQATRDWLDAISRRLVDDRF